MSFYVSRQCYWPHSQYTVEVAEGGIDYANPDMLVTQYGYEGEGEEFTSAVEAAEAAIRVAIAWQKDKPDKKIHLGYGNTCGMTLPFDPCSEVQLLAWAYEHIPMCTNCGKECEDPIEVENPETNEDLVVCSLECEREFYSDFEDDEDEEGE